MIDVFSTEEHFTREFAAGLRRLATSVEPGAFILAAANYCQSPELLGPEFRDRLRVAFDEVRSAFRSQLDRPAPDEPEDVTVLRRLEEWGFERVAPASRRTIDGLWTVQLNPLRALRPARLAAEPVPGIDCPADFARMRFHYDQRFVQPERIHEGPFNGREASLFFNKYPFARRHGVLVPEPGAHVRQFLRREDHEWARALARSAGAKIPGFGLGYNSVGAGASVNHRHWQTFIEPEPFPVMHPRWEHNGGREPYPLDCARFEDVEDSWNWIARRHEADAAYNLIYKPEATFCFARAMQGSYPRSDWAGVFAWYECAGCMIALRESDYRGLTGAMVLAEFAATRGAPR